jgi:hypothetical protein
MQRPRLSRNAGQTTHGEETKALEAACKEGLASQGNRNASCPPINALDHASEVEGMKLRERHPLYPPITASFVR